jgi:hypothetical protein
LYYVTYITLPLLQLSSLHTFEWVPLS